MTPLDVDAPATLVLSWLLTYGLHSTLLIGAVWLVARRFPEEHAWLDLAWKAALVGPLVTATIQVAGGMMPLGGRLPLHLAAPYAAVPVAPKAQHEDLASPRLSAPRLESTALSEAESPSTAVSSVAAAEQPSAAAGPPWLASSWTALRRDWPRVVAGAWIGIASVLLALFGVRVLRVHRALRRAAQVPPLALQAVADAISDRQTDGARIRLAVSAACSVPLAMQGRWVLLPERVCRDLDPQEQRAALAHEIAHVLRRDPAWRLAAGVVERIAFFQPLNRVARRRLCEAAEFPCDQWAVGRTDQPIALARSLATVASWTAAPGARTPAGASAMAQADSPLVRRVTSILDQRHRPVARHAWLVVAAGVLAVAVAAPGVLAAREEAPAPADRPDASVAPAASAPAPGAENRQIRRPPSPGAPLSARWQWALDEASRQRLRDFWVVYSFVTPTHAGDLMMSDTADGSFVSRGGRFVTDGNALSNQLDAIAPLDSRGAVVAMFHHVAPNVEGINRAGYRSPQLGFKFGSSPVFWLGHATEDDSFARVRELFDQVRPEELQTFLIELASLHPTTDRVLPFLEGLLVPSRSVEIRREAAEGFDHHHDPRSVAVLMRVARTDPDVEVRAEAAETIGEVQTPESIPALTELATTSPDERVRSEAAEAFADQPVDAALPALERLIATSTYDDVLGEAVEALGEIKDPRVLPLLVRTATTHKSQRAQQEAVETIGEVEDASAVTALVDIIWKHTDVVMQREAVETLGDRSPVPKAELRRVRKDHPREEVREEAQETLDDHR